VDAVFPKNLKRRRAALKVLRDLVPSPHERPNVAQETTDEVPLEAVAFIIACSGGGWQSGWKCGNRYSP